MLRASGLAWVDFKTALSMACWIKVPFFHHQEQKGKVKGKIPINGYEADSEDTEKISPPAPRKGTKSRKSGAISGQEISESSISVYLLKVALTLCWKFELEKEIGLFSESSKWKHML